VGGFPETFKMKEISEWTQGKPTIVDTDVEPIELVKIKTPNITFDERPERRVNAQLGSKHGGMRSIGVSDERIVEEMGLGILDEEKERRILEEERFGKTEPFNEGVVEQEFEPGETED
jgi:hypothetical protein